MKSILKEVTDASPNVLFGCESAAAESYIPYLLFNDNRFNLNFYVGKQVPVYAYVYHEYLNNFMGNQVSVHGCIDFEKSPDNLYERIAYSFSAGDMLTLVLNDSGEIAWNWGVKNPEFTPEQEPVKVLVKNLNLWRSGYGKKYLHTGKMVKPFSVDSGVNRFITTKGGSIVRDNIYTRAWLSQNGEYGQFVINYNNKEIECKISLPEGIYRLVYVDGRTEKITPGNTELKLNKLSAVLIEKLEE